MKTKWSLVLGLSVFCGLSMQAHAQIITKDTEAELNTMHQAATAVEQYLKQGEQYAKQIEQYVQQVKNAKGLGDVLKNITGDDFSKIDSVEKGFKAANDLIYNLDPNQDKGYVKKARDLLEKIYNLPKEVNSAQEQLTKILEGKDHSDDPYSPEFNPGNRDVKKVVQLENDLNEAYNHAIELRDKNMKGQEAVLRELGDDDMGETLQLIASQTNTIQYQNLDSIKIERIIATNQQLDRIHQLEEANKTAEKVLASLKKVKEYTMNDGKKPSKDSKDSKDPTKKG